MVASSEVVIGSYRVLSSCDWSTLDAEIARIFMVRDRSDCSVFYSVTLLKACKHVTQILQKILAYY